MSYKKTDKINGRFTIVNGHVFIDNISDDGVTPPLEINQKLLLRDAIEQDLKVYERIYPRNLNTVPLDYIEGDKINQLHKKPTDDETVS